MKIYSIIHFDQIPKAKVIYSNKTREVTIELLSDKIKEENVRRMLSPRWVNTEKGVHTKLDIESNPFEYILNLRRMLNGSYWWATQSEVEEEQDELKIKWLETNIDYDSENYDWLRRAREKKNE